MLIKSYGLFWEADEIDWNPGKGNKDSFRLLGRKGSNRPSIRIADFRFQQGIYILYGNYGPHYVGLTKKMGLGERIKNHLTDEHKNEWNRFSWFGFQSVLKKKDENGICLLKDLAALAVGEPKIVISDTEALLIKAMGLSNKADMKFYEADEWIQIEELEIEHYLEKVR